MEEMLLLIINELRKAGEPDQHSDTSDACQQLPLSSRPPSRSPDTGILSQYPDVPDSALFSRLIDRLGKGRPDAQDYSKQNLLPYYQQVKKTDPKRWESWNIDPELEKRFFRIMRIKPRRTASGVATITVITKPWRCGSDCLYCPNDLRMPKSYLSDEPACQRAERNFFDPYLQVQARLRVLNRMGHLTDKVEIIVLGGSWCDYPPSYQIWFVSELYRALNDGEAGWPEAQQLIQDYLDLGLHNDKDDLIRQTTPLQQQIKAGTLNYNQAIRQLYEESEAWQTVVKQQQGSMDALCKEQSTNETAAHRMVGFTVETRPDLVTSATLKLLRQLGVTRLQIGIQSLDPQVLKLNRRKTTPEQIRNAFALARTFGFKIHAHFMQNLYGSSLAADEQEYQQFMTDPAYLPDEVKLYPCSLVADTDLCAHHASGSWQPYTEQELIELLAADTLNTPPFVRISRMIRDISSHDIIAGSKRTNLRQLVEKNLEDTGKASKIQEIRYREIATSEVIQDDLQLDIITYKTTVSTEHFLQWITQDNKIAGFLRLSLPAPMRSDYLPANTQLPPVLKHAIIREVHVYGKVAAINKAGESVQHLGLGKQLIEKACELAQKAGHTRINVISSVGTRRYYQNLNFTNKALYQQKQL